MIYQILNSTQIFLLLFGACMLSSIFWLNFPFYHHLYRRHNLLNEYDLSLLRRGAAIATAPIVYLWGAWFHIGLNRGIFEYILTKTFFSYIMYIKNIYDALEIVLLPLLGVYLVKTYYLDKSKSEDVKPPPGQQQWGQPPQAYGRAPGMYRAAPGWDRWPQQGQQGGAWQRR